MEVTGTRWTASHRWDVALPDWDGPSTVVLVFGDSDLASNDAPFADLRRKYPQSALLGCSGAGQIANDVVQDGGLTVTVVRFASCRVSKACVDLPSAQASEQAGRELARRVVEADPGVKAIFVLSEGIEVNGSQLVAGLRQGCPDETVITGGLAGDGERFEKTWVLADGRPTRRVVTAIGLGGPHLRVAHASRGGWDIFGPERRITRSVGNVLYELDGRPALGLYRRYLGSRAAGLPATALLFPLAVRASREDADRVVRTVLAIDEANQAMTFAGDMVEGSYARLMRANFDRLVHASQEAAAQASGHHPGTRSTTLALAVSCVGRRIVLGARTDEELEAALAGLAPGTDLVGFYSYGEISPIGVGDCDLHNQTMTLTTWSEDE